MLDHLVQASQTSAQPLSQTQWHQLPDLETQIARLRFLNRTEVELAQAISRMID